jgi:hypothetical protein
MEPAKVMRFDSGSSLRPPVETPQGYLRVDGYAARVGIYEYADPKYPGGIRRELRPAEEVSRMDSLAGYEGAPITVMHPPKMLTAENTHAYEVGAATLPGRMDGDNVAVAMVVKDRKTVGKMKAKELTELSPGYRIRLDHTPGNDPRYATPRNPRGEYHVVQRDIEINHMALLPPDHARGGNGMSVRMDGVDVPVEVRLDNLDAAPPRLGAPTMEQEEQIRLLKQKVAELEAAQKERTDSLITQQERADRAEARVRALEGEVTELNTRIAAGATAAETAAIKEQAERADKAELAVRQFDERFDAAVETRCEIVEQVRAVMGPSFTIGPKMSNRDLQAVVVKRLDSKADISSAASDATIDGSFRALVELRHRTAQSLTRAGESLLGHRTDTQMSRETEREKKRDAHRNQWREPLPSSQLARTRQKGG